MDFDNLVLVFGCFIVTDSMPKTSSFCTVSSSSVNMLDCLIDFHKLEPVSGSLKAADFMWSLFDVL